MRWLGTGGSVSIAYLSLVYLLTLDANTTNYLGSWSGSHNLEKVKRTFFVDQPKWVWCSFDRGQYMLRSTSCRRLMRYPSRRRIINSARTLSTLTFFCPIWLKNSEKILPCLQVALSATAQQILIHAALKLYTFCKKHRTYTGRQYRWQDWKAVFKEAKTIENIKARKDALAAVVAIDTAEQLLQLFSSAGKGRRNYDAWNVETVGTKMRILMGKPQQRKCDLRVGESGVGRSFPEYYESRTNVI